MFDKIINKVFFTKRVFKIMVVLTFFVSLWMFGRMCYNHHNPYDYVMATNYANLVEFVEEDLVWDELEYEAFDYDEFEYEHALINQAMRKDIVDLSQVGKYNRERTLIALALSCEPEKFDRFKKQYKERKDLDYMTAYGVDTEQASIDCAKAKTVPLERENYYFLRHDLVPYVIGAFVLVPLAILLFWLVIRFVFLAPVLWAVRKD